MAAIWDDPRIKNGLRDQFAQRRAQMDAGAKPIGWKVGFGAPAVMQKLGITGPLLGFMTDRNLLQSGVVADVSAWSKAIAEPEIAVHLGRDVEGGADRAAAAAAVAAVSPAIELVDLNQAPEDPQAILTCNIYHRHVVLGPKDTSRGGVKLDGLAGEVWKNDAKVADVSDLQANTGDIADLVRHVAHLLAASGERLRAGEVIICGSVVPPIMLEPQDRSVTLALKPGAEASVRFAW